MGTYALNRFQLVKALLVATHYGDRLIGSARSYGNEQWMVVLC